MALSLAPEAPAPPPKLMQRLRREPFRLFMPLGMVLAWAGVAHWILHATGVLADYRSIFHAMTQIQGFMLAFAMGFLLTMLPRRTGTEPPASWQIIIAAVAPVGTVVFAWFQKWAESQIFWLVLGLVLLGFVSRRLFSPRAKRRAPNSFIWLPIALIMGVSGAVMAAVYGIYGESLWWLHNLGRGLLLQGMFIGFILGVAGLAMPLMTRGEPPPDGMRSRSDLIACAGHGLAASVLVTTFWIEQFVSLRAAMALRAIIIVVVLVSSAKVHRRPTKPGWNRQLIWLAGWMLPLGYIVAAILHTKHKVGLHITFIGGFAMLALAVGVQVILGHTGDEKTKAGRPWQVPAIAGALLLAIIPRGLMELDPDRFFVWMAIAAGLFLSGLVVWSVLLLPRLRSP